MMKSTHDVHYLFGSTIQFKKAIKRRLAVLSDPIVAVMGIRIKTKKTELRIYSLLRLGGFKGERLQARAGAPLQLL